MHAHKLQRKSAKRFPADTLAPIHFADNLFSEVRIKLQTYRFRFSELIYFNTLYFDFEQFIQVEFVRCFNKTVWFKTVAYR